MFTVPDGALGTVALQLVVDVQETPVAAFVPKSTVVPPEVVTKLVPVKVTVLPPAAGPEVGEIEVRVGAI